MSTEPSRIWGHYDENTGTGVTAHTYPYGQGIPEHGIQLTMRKGTGYQGVAGTQVTRLPADIAVVLARAILTTYATGDGDVLLAPHEVASMLRVSSKTVAKWATAGRLPCTRTVGGHRRFRLSDVLASMAEGAEVRDAG